MKGRACRSLVFLLLLVMAMAPSIASAMVKITVTICCEQVDRAEWLQSVAQAYMKANPQVEVTPLVNVTLDKLTTMIAGGAGPDLIWVGQAWGSQMSYLTPLSGLLAKAPAFAQDLVPAMLKGFSYNGVTYAIPFSAATRTYAYNADLLQQMGMQAPAKSWTWDDALRMAKKATQDTNGDGRPEVWGLALNWQPWGFFGYGGSIYRDNGRNAHMNQEVILKATGIFQDVWSGKAGVMPSGYAGISDGPDKLFFQGRLALWDVGVFDVPLLRQQARFAWDVQEPPLLEFDGKLHKGGAWTGEGYGLFNGSKHPEEAFRFAQFMLSKEWLSRLTEQGAIMPASFAALSASFLNSRQPPANMRAFLNAVDYELGAWAHPAFGKVMDRMFHPIWNQDPPHSGSKPMQSILVESQAALQSALDEFYQQQR